MISDPGFYAVAIPAVLLMGISKRGFGAGFGALSGRAVAGIVGAMTLLFVAIRVLFPPRADAAQWIPGAWLGLLDMQNFSTSLALATPRGGRPPTARRSRFGGGKLGCRCVFHALRVARGAMDP